MPHSPDFWGLISALVISLISGFISISRRIMNGQVASLLWVTTEFMTAILFGYLAYVTYPILEPTLPDWFTIPVAVALAAHMGGRTFQEIETLFLQYLKGRFLKK